MFRWKTFSLLSITILISLLSAFYLTRIPTGAAVTETTNVEPTTWSMAKPAYETGIGQSIENLYNSDSVVANFTVSVSDFMTVSLEGDGQGQTLMTLVWLNVVVLGGNVQSVNLWFNWGRPSELSTVYVDQQPGEPMPFLQNLTLTGVYDKDTHDAVMTTVAVPNCNGCNVHARVYWLLETADASDHQLNYSGEVVYQDVNGTLRRVSIPINVELFQNYNDGFEAAQEVGLGVYNPDPFRVIVVGESDYYKFRVESGESYNITATARGPFEPYYGGGLLSLCLYNESQGLLASSQSTTLPMPPEVSIGPMTYSGYLYVRVECLGGANPYSLEVSPIE